ncbi:hypothetical protein CTheo_3659 [Ceratobasidium theobromae]|uniref:Effector protein n=1 Tax=Ceratobasidium theobromae TaxID=1582974 RepID=A0A5N5QM80_9AGAM|nr:hypothetical protein CTheo_3659 [Ceratobasidium theobromae]
MFANFQIILIIIFLGLAAGTPLANPPIRGFASEPREYLLVAGRQDVEGEKDKPLFVVKRQTHHYFPGDEPPHHGRGHVTREQAGPINVNEGNQTHADENNKPLLVVKRQTHRYFPGDEPPHHHGRRRGMHRQTGPNVNRRSQDRNGIPRGIFRPHP